MPLTDKVTTVGEVSILLTGNYKGQTAFRVDIINESREEKERMIFPY